MGQPKDVIDAEEDVFGSLGNLSGNLLKAASSSNLASEALRDDISEVGHIIQGLKHNKHSDKFGQLGRPRLGSDELGPEEEKRLREVERQRQIKRDLMARDPRRKVEQKVESRRQYEAGTSGAPVPMITVSVQGIHGPERIPIVDIRTIRSRCTQLISTCSVSTLLEDQIKRDEHEKEQANTIKDEDAQIFDMPVQTTFKDRCLQARQKKKAMQVDKQVHRLNVMRSECPEGVMERYEAESFSLNTSKQEELLNIMATLHQATTTSRNDRAANILAADLPKGQHDPGATSRSTRADRKFKTMPTSRVVYRCPTEIKTQVKRRWTLLRGVTKLLLVWLVHVKRTRRIETVKGVLTQFGEWSRVKHAMIKLSNDVRKLQRAARAFLALKRQRCDLILADWKRVEDEHLVKYFKLYTELVVEDAHRTAEGRRPFLKSRINPEEADIFETIQKEFGLDSHKGTGGDHSLAMRTVDWKPFKIPRAPRKHMVSRYYMVQLRRHVLGRTNVMDVFRKALERQKDMVHFLQSLGADVTNSESLDTDEVLLIKAPAFVWRPSEDVMLNLIALAAQDLMLAAVLPFRDHGSRKDIKGNTMFRGNDQALQHLRQGMFSVHGDMKAITQVTQEEAQAPKKSAAQHDMDDIFDSFVPKYRE